MGRKKKIKEVVALEVRKYKQQLTVLIFPHPNGVWEAICVDFNFSITRSDCLTMPDIMNLFDEEYANRVNYYLNKEEEPFHDCNEIDIKQLEIILKNSNLYKNVIKWNFKYKGD